MAILHLDGFDHYQNVGGTLTGADFPNIGYTITATNNSLVTVGTGSSNASRAIAISRSANGIAKLSKQIHSTGDKVIIGFAMHATARERIVSVTGVFDVEWPATGYPKIGTDSGPTIPILNTWYYYELVINKTAKQVTLWLNGFEQFTSTFTADVPDDIEVVWGWNTMGPAAVLKIDDLCVVDNADPTSVNTDRVGPLQVTTRFPSAGVQNQWTASTTQKQNWQIVSQVPANQLEYVQSNTLDAVDVYQSTQAVTGDVVAVAVSVLSAKADVDDHSIRVLIRQDGTDKESRDIPLSLQYTYNQAVFERDVNDLAWTAESASNARFGIKVK